LTACSASAISLVEKEGGSKLEVTSRLGLFSKALVSSKPIACARSLSAPTSRLRQERERARGELVSVLDCTTDETGLDEAEDLAAVLLGDDRHLDDVLLME
jgi:hypothetical protein